MRRDKPEFKISRLFRRGHPHLAVAECAAHDAPFPSMACRAATQALPERVPGDPAADGVSASREAAAFWRERWQGRSMMETEAKDPVFTPAAMEGLRQQIRGCPPSMPVDGGAWLSIVAKQGVTVTAGHHTGRWPSLPELWPLRRARAARTSIAVSF